MHPNEAYKNAVAKHLAGLTRREKIALCLVCCNRLAPLYTQFSQIENWGDDNVFLQCRTEARDLLEGKRKRLSIRSKDLDPHVPDMDDFGTILGSFALNAGCAHFDLIKQTRTDDSRPTADALVMCYDTVDFCVQDEKGRRELDGYMNREVKWQLKAMQAIRGEVDLPRYVQKSIGDRTVSQLIERVIMRHKQSKRDG